MSIERVEKTLDWREIGTKIPWKVRISPRPVRPGFQGLYWTDIKLHTEFQREWRWPRLLEHTPSNSLETNLLTPESRPPSAARKFAILVLFSSIYKGKSRCFELTNPIFSCLRRKMVILYYGYQARRRRQRKFWIYMLYRFENRAVGARFFFLKSGTP